MREIKFRGSPIEDYGDLKWIEGGIYLNRDDRLAYINSDDSGVVPVHWESLGQYTGLKDSEGREIYEGDIWVIGDKKVKVEFDQERAGFFPFATSDGCGCCDDETYDPKNGEVIGNIYENPELLTEK